MLRNDSESWEYTCHILLPNNHVMECTGIHVGTSDSLNDYVDGLAEKHGGSVRTIVMRCADKSADKSTKPRVRTKEEPPQQAAAPIALPAPPKEVPKHIMQLPLPVYPAPTMFVHTIGDTPNVNR